jgi:hypothetical protein
VHAFTCGGDLDRPVSAADSGFPSALHYESYTIPDKVPGRTLTKAVVSSAGSTADDAIEILRVVIPFFCQSAPARRLASRPWSTTDHAVRVCEGLLACDPVIGMICFPSARQGSHSRLHR